MSLNKKNELIDSYYNSHRTDMVEQLKKLLSFESVSTDPAFEARCIECATWLKEHLNSFGGKTELISTPGKPIVYAEFQANSEKPAKPVQTLLFYGHYDVQPADPVELWQTPPFEAIEKNGRLYARGAQDNKGQSFYFLKALEMAVKQKALSYNVKIILEGEEECGSGGIAAVLSQIAAKCKSDILLVCDTGTLSEKLGAITMGLRGIAHAEVKVTGPHKDLHSGVHGGVVKNPAVVLSKMVAALHDKDGKVSVPGFYDGMTPLSKLDQERASKFPISDSDYTALVGVAPTGGEDGFSMPVRRGLRPTVEINGLTSGYQGEGSKTIIPSWASAKFSCRLIAGQDPENVLSSVINFLKQHCPSELNFEVVHQHASGGALRVSSESPIIDIASKILNEITGTEPLYIWEGASIPLISDLHTAVNATPLLVGFGLEEDNIHAPNESFSLEQFRKGFIFCAKLLTHSYDE
jgi:acetylornithine deacetylase/succinyl-diaminopimelate desuccinylase-like protein